MLPCFAEAPLATYDSLRLGLRVPDGSRDLIVEKALLLENGFDELNGVDWQAGFDELMAQQRARSQAATRMKVG